MPDYESLFPGRFLKKTDLERPTVIKILEVSPAGDALVEEPPKNAKKPPKKEKAKGIVVFAYKAGSLGSFIGKEMILNKTNAALLAHALDERDFTRWAGHYVTLYDDPTVRWAGEEVGGIRVFGSPEMSRKKRVEIKMPRRSSSEFYDLTPTNAAGRAVAVGPMVKAATAATPSPAASPPAASVDSTAQADQPPPDDAREPGAEG